MISDSHKALTQGEFNLLLILRLLNEGTYTLNEAVEKAKETLIDWHQIHNLG